MTSGCAPMDMLWIRATRCYLPCGRRRSYEHGRTARTSVVSRIRCRRLRAAIGAQRKPQPVPSVLASDATPRCASMASADRQMIGDATLGGTNVSTESLYAVYE